MSVVTRWALRTTPRTITQLEGISREAGNLIYRVRLTNVIDDIRVAIIAAAPEVELFQGSSYAKSGRLIFAVEAKNETAPAYLFKTGGREQNTTESRPLSIFDCSSFDMYESGDIFERLAGKTRKTEHGIIGGLVAMVRPNHPLKRLVRH